MVYTLFPSCGIVGIGLILGYIPVFGLRKFPLLSPPPPRLYDLHVIVEKYNYVIGS